MYPPFKRTLSANECLVVYDLDSAGQFLFSKTFIFIYQDEQLRNVYNSADEQFFTQQ